MVTPHRIVALLPMEAPRLTSVGTHAQSASVCSCAGRGGGPRVLVVDEHHAVADEDLVLDGHAFADEGVAGDLDPAADAGAFLDFDEGADLALVTDLAAIEVDEGVEPGRRAPA